MAKKTKNKPDAYTGATLPINKEAYYYNEFFGPLEDRMELLQSEAEENKNMSIALKAAAAHMDLGTYDKPPHMYKLKGVSIPPLDKRGRRTQEFIRGLSDEQISALSEKRDKNFKGTLDLVRDLSLKPSQIGPAISAYRYGKENELFQDGGLLPEMKKGGWIKKAAASVKRRGTEGKCGPNCDRPGCTGRALALCRAFHTIAARRKRKEEGGYLFENPEEILEFAKGGGLSSISADKAREMLENPPHGRPLTDKQEKTFRAIAHGWEPDYQDGGMLESAASMIPGYGPLISAGMDLTEGITGAWASKNDQAMQDMISSGRINVDEYMKQDWTSALKKGTGLGLFGIGKALIGQIGERKRVEKMAGDMRHDRHLKMRMNSLPTAAHGGFIEYKGNTHDDEGGGIPVDKYGNPSLISNNASVALTEDKEVAWFTPEEGAYIFSEDLGFAKPAKKLINKYKLDKDDSLIKHDPMADEAVHKQFYNLKEAQEMKRSKEGKTSEFAKGGNLPMKQFGGPEDEFDPYALDVAYTPQAGRFFNRPLTLGPNFLGSNQQYNLDRKFNITPFNFSSLSRYPGVTPSKAPTEMTNINRFYMPKKSPYGEVAEPIDTSSLVGIEDASDRILAEPEEANMARNLSPLGHGLSAVGAVADYFAFKRRAKPESVGRVGAERVSYARDRLSMLEEATGAKRVAATTARDQGLNAATATANIIAGRTGVDRLLGQERSESFEREENINAQMRQQAGLTNAELKLMDIQNKISYNRELAARSPFANLAKIAASYFADNAGYRTMQESRFLENPNMNVEQGDSWLDWLLGMSPDEITYSD